MLRCGKRLFKRGALFALALLKKTESREVGKLNGCQESRRDSLWPDSFFCAERVIELAIVKVHMLLPSARLTTVLWVVWCCLAVLRVCQDMSPLQEPEHGYQKPTPKEINSTSLSASVQPVIRNRKRDAVCPSFVAQVVAQYRACYRAL